MRWNWWNASRKLWLRSEVNEGRASGIGQLSDGLQRDILNVLAVFHPEPLTEKQYHNLFYEKSCYQMAINIYYMVMSDWVSESAIVHCENKMIVDVAQLTLTQSGYQKVALN